MGSVGAYVLRTQELSAPGHDRDCALAMLSQAEHGRPLDNIQVVHLLSIGYRAGRQDELRRLRDELPGAVAEELRGLAAELRGQPLTVAEFVSMLDEIDGRKA